MKYNNSMAEILAEMRKVKEQETDPIAKAQDNLTKAKKIADLKKQIDTVKKAEMKEDGHVDVASAVRHCKTIIEDCNDIMTKLNGMGEQPLPSWLTDKITVAADDLNGARDYLMNPQTEALDDKDKETIKPIIKQLKKSVKAHDKQAKQLQKDIEDETDLEEFKKMVVTIKDPSKRRKAMDDIKRFGKKTGFRIDKMRDGKSFKIDGKGKDLNKFAIDMKNFYGAEVKAESYEPLVEFTSSQIARLKKEYEPFRNKPRPSPEKFNRLRGIMKRFTKAQLLQIVKADIPILSSGAKASLVLNHGMKYASLPEDFIPYMEIFADDNKELNEQKKSKFKEVEPKVIDRIEKMMRGTRKEKDSIANMLNYLMPPEVVDMVRYKLKIVPKRGKIKF